MRILFALSCLLTIVFPSCNDGSEVINKTTLIGIQNRINKEIQKEEDRFDHAFYEYQDLLNDLVKIKYRVLLVGLDSIRMARSRNKSNFRLLESRMATNEDVSIKNLQDYQDEMIKFDSIIMNEIIRTLRLNSENFGFYEEETSNYIKSKKNDYDKNKNENLVELSNDRNLDLKLKMIHLSNYDRLICLEDILMELSGGSALNCFGKMYFPIVMPESNIVDKGKGGVIKIAVGQYWTSLNPNDTKMIINSDTIQMAGDGTVNYQINPTSTGEQKLQIKCIVRNPLTGVFDESIGSEYVYWVK